MEVEFQLYSVQWQTVSCNGTVFCLSYSWFALDVMAAMLQERNLNYQHINLFLSFWADTACTMKEGCILRT